MSSSSFANLLPLLVLFGPVTAVLLACRFLNRRDERRLAQPAGVAQFGGERLADRVGGGMGLRVVQAGRRSQERPEQVPAQL